MMTSLTTTTTPHLEPLAGPITLSCGRGTVAISEVGTTSKNKLKEYRAAGLHLEERKIEVREQQPNSEQDRLIAEGEFEMVSRAIAAEKAEAAFYALDRPILIEDTSLYVYAVPQLTGPLIKRWLLPNPETGENRLRELTTIATMHNDRRAVAYCVLAVSNGKDTATWVGKVDGQLPDNPRGDSNFGWDCIFMPHPASQLIQYDQEKIRTWAEMTFEEKSTMFPFRGLAVENLRKSVVSS